MTLRSINPATDQLIGEYPEHTPQQVAEALAAGQRAFLAWRHTPLLDRATGLHRVARALRQNRGQLAALMTAEMGKPLSQSGAEVDKCIVCCEYFADYGPSFLGRENIRTEATESCVVFEPIGVILGVMPWNFPLWQVFRAAVPALMAGNAMVLKHASNVSGCALAIASLFKTAGMPEGLFQTLLVSSQRVAELIASPVIRGVTLTGSTAAGVSVASQAASLIKKTVLELGGSDPYLVLEDADLPTAARLCAASRLINSGQSCIAAKRFIVVESVRQEFESLLVREMQQQRMGDPMAPSTTVGPLARRDLRDELHSQVERSMALGARLLCGGSIPTGPGAYYPPTVLSGVHKGMPAFDEETFGPVAAVTGVGSEEEAILAANDSSYGLGAAVFTRNVERASRVAAALEAGVVFINDFVRSDPRLPFGGIKASGYGRELSAFGIREFVNIKTVWRA